jgi:hypothetical protein
MNNQGNLGKGIAHIPILGGIPLTLTVIVVLSEIMHFHIVDAILVFRSLWQKEKTYHPIYYQSLWCSFSESSELSRTSSIFRHFVIINFVKLAVVMGSRLMVAFLDAILDHRPLGRNEKMPPQISGRSELSEVPRYASIFFIFHYIVFMKILFVLAKIMHFRPKVRS